MPEFRQNDEKNVMQDAGKVEGEAEPVRPTPDEVNKAVENDIPPEHLDPMIDRREGYIGDFIGAIYQFMYNKYFDKLVNDEGMDEEKAAELANSQTQDYLDSKGLTWF